MQSALSALGLFFRILTILFLVSNPSQVALAAVKNVDVLDRIVAIVNNDAIPESAVLKQAELLISRFQQTNMEPPPRAELKKQILDKMIIDKLQLQMAAELKIEVDEDTVTQAMQDIAARDNLSLDQLKEALKEQNLPFSQFKETIKTEIIISRLQQREVGQNINVAKTEVDQFLKSPEGQDHSGMEYHLGHILIGLPENASNDKINEIEKSAQAIVNELKQGADFGKMAISKSQGSQALQGGDIGYKKAAELPTLFAKAIPKLKPGELYGPVRNDSGFHIVKLIGKRFGNGEKQDAENLRNQAMDLLYQRKFEEKVNVWLRRIRDEATVEVFALND